MVLNKDIINFLKALGKNNNREWFNANKSLFNKLKLEFETYIQLIIKKVHEFDRSIGVLMAKDTIYRIYRDIRFTHDKTPYKTNFGAYISRGGRSGGYAGYYLHIEPGASMLAGGLYMPQPDILKAVRTEIYENIEEFKGIIGSRDFSKYFKEIWGEKLKSVPQGFPKDFEDGELLKFKHYTVSVDLTDEEVADEGYTETAIKVFKALKPFNMFLNNAIENIKR
jgi:uncharacterized protein (TIGR02453 family)